MLRSRLTKIARSLDEEIDPAMRKAAAAIAEGAQSRVPVDTGRLKDAIHVEKVSDGHYLVVAGNDGAFYGHIVEHGSVDAPPHPFLVPAFEAEKGNVDTAVKNALRDL